MKKSKRPNELSLKAQPEPDPDPVELVVWASTRHLGWWPAVVAIPQLKSCVEDPQGAATSRTGHQANDTKHSNRATHEASMPIKLLGVFSE